MSLKIAPSGREPAAVPEAPPEDPLQDWCLDQLRSETRVATILALQAELLTRRRLRAPEIILLARAMGTEPRPVLALMGYVPGNDGMTYRDVFASDASDADDPPRRERREDIAARALLARLLGVPE